MHGRRVLCLVGALGALVFLPGRVRPTPETGELLTEPQPLAA